MKNHKRLASAVLAAGMMLQLGAVASATEPASGSVAVEAPGTYYIQNDGAHYIDGDPLKVLTKDLGTGTFYLEKTNADLVVLADGTVTDGILSQIDSETTSTSTGDDLIYTSAVISGTGIILGTGNAELSITATETTAVTVTVESLDKQGKADKVLEATANVAAGTNTTKFALKRAYDDGQGEQPEHAAYKLAAGSLRVHVTADKAITVNQGAASTVTLPFLYESQTGYNGKATMDGKSFNATLYWLQSYIYLYDHDSQTWKAKIPADSEYYVDDETHEAVFADFSFYALKTIKNGAVQKNYKASGTSLYPFPSVRKLHVDTVPVNGVKDLLYLPTVMPLYQDIFMPYDGVDEADEDNLPVLIYIHGFGGSYSDPKQSLAYESLANGYAVVGIDLRNYPPEFAPTYYQDINGNIRYIRANAEKYGLDADRIGVYGVSLGGNSSLMAGVANDNEYTEGTVGGNLDVSSRVQAIISGYAWTDALNFGADQRTDNADDPTLLGSMISGGDGENAPCAQAIDFYGPGKGYLVLRNYLAEREEAEAEGKLDEFLAEPYTFTIDQEYVNKWFPNLGNNAFTAGSTTVTAGTYTWDHDYLMEKVNYAKAASPLYHITPDDPSIMVFGGYGGKQNITNTQSTRTLKKAAEMGIEAVMAGNTQGNYGNEEEVVASMVEFLDKTLKYGPTGTKVVLTVGSKNAVVNALDVKCEDALIDDNGLKIKASVLNDYFGTEYADEYVAVTGLKISGVTVKTYTYDVYVSDTETEERTSVVLFSSVKTASASKSEVKEAEKVSLPGEYYGYYDDEGGELKTYDSYIVKSEYVRVPSHYDSSIVEFPSDPNNDDPSYDEDTGTIQLAVTYVIPSNDGVTAAEGEFPTILEISRGGREMSSSQFNVEGLVTHGYVWSIIEMRGCGASFGVNNSFASLENRNDVKYLIEKWYPEQSWCNGKFATTGGSNRGLIQWATATTDPEGLIGLFPSVNNPDFYYQDYRNGASCVPGGGAKLSGTGGDVTVKSYEEWIKKPGVTFVDGDTDGKQAYEAYKFYTKNNLTFTKVLLKENMTRDEAHTELYGEKVNLTIPAVEYSEVLRDSGIQYSQTGGWFDANTTFQLASANAYGGKVIMGPWGHGAGIRGTEDERYADSKLSILDQQLRYFDAILKDVDNGYEDSPKFYYYVLNAKKGENWRYSDTFPLENSTNSVLYLSDENSGEIILDDLKLDGEQSNNGKLSLVKAESETEVDYRVDTSIKPINFSNLDLSKTGEMKDEVDAKGLTFTSAPLSAAAEIVGIPTVDLWVSCDNSDDADFICYLEEVSADGSSKMITQGCLRASHRTTGENILWDSTEGLAGRYHTSLTADVEAALAEGMSEPVHLAFNLEAVAYQVAKGSSIRLTVTCANTSVYQHQPYYQVDENGEYVVGSDGKYVLKTGDDLPLITLYQGGEHASYVTIPVVDNVSNVYNGTVTFDDGSYTGPATMYLFEENWFLYANGMWTKLNVANGEADYTVESGKAIFEAGFSFLPEVSKVIKNGIAQNYTGGGSYVLPFPSEYNIHLDDVANQTGNTNANTLLYLPATESLDINLFMPDDAEEPVPVIIYIHGFSGTNIDIDTNLLPLLEEGYAIAGVELRNYPPNENPLYYQDIKGNIRYLRAHAEELGIDPDRIGIYGVSLGGNTSLMMAISGGDEFLEGDVGGNTDVSSRVQAAISGYAWSDALYFGADQRDDYDYNPTLWKNMISGGDGESAPCAQAIDFSGPGKGYLVLRNYLEAREAAEAAGTLDAFLAEDYTLIIDKDYVDKWFPGQEGSTNAYIGSGATVTLGTYTYTHEYMMQKVKDAEAASPAYYATPDDPTIVVFGGFGGTQNITNTQSVRTQYALQQVGVQCFYFGNSVTGFNDYNKYGNPSSIQAGFLTYWDHYLKEGVDGTKIVLTVGSDKAVVNYVDRDVTETVKVENGEVKIPASVLNKFLGTELTGWLTMDEVAALTGKNTVTWYEDYQMLVIDTDYEMGEIVTPDPTPDPEPDDDDDDDTPSKPSTPSTPSTPVTPVEKATFTDVPKSHWAYEAVEYLAKAGLVTGTGDGTTFSPDASTTRAMMVTILYRMAGSPAVSGSSVFTDVADGQWYTNAIIWATQQGIVNGYDDGTFGVNDLVTREQMAAFLFRFAKAVASGSLSGFVDADSVSAWAKEAMSWTAEQSFITGKPGSLLDPQGSASRAELVTVLYRYLTK